MEEEEVEEIEDEVEEIEEDEVEDAEGEAEGSDNGKAEQKFRFLQGNSSFISVQMVTKRRPNKRKVPPFFFPFDISFELALNVLNFFGPYVVQYESLFS